MSDVLKTACIQMNSSPDVEENLKVAEVMVSEAAAQGAKLICTPENTDFMCARPEEKRALAVPESNHPALSLFAGLAKEQGVWILAGSLTVKEPEEEKFHNRSYLFNDKGDIVAKYDKIHMFDVDLPTGESFRESKAAQPGETAVLAQTPWGGLGLSICYDVRFAALYRTLAQAGAKILAVPAAFAVPTGKVHWEILLRARAIETGSYVLAPGQCGTHAGGRTTYGHSLIINPWGEIIAQAGDEPCMILADLDMDMVEKTRAGLPSLRHDRDFTLNQ
ncbi:MAG: carbon-nitrogen hydrolase family protein [Rhodospirillales bacterium]|nr:carbon-nitrogen hydrolase family protein [Rhodospirillales bacterium]